MLLSSCTYERVLTHRIGLEEAPAMYRTFCDKTRVVHQSRAEPGGLIAMAWIRDRALTLAMARFLLFLAGQMITGSADYSSEQAYAETGR